MQYAYPISYLKYKERKYIMSVEVLGTVYTDVLYSLSDNNQNINVGNHNDLVVTGNGDDKINGGNGDDFLFGQGGKDTLLGGNGSDLLWGGFGADTLTGGNGNDTFVYSWLEESTSGERDKITDFKGGDHIVLTAIDASTSGWNDQAFSFIGNHAFSGQEGELRAYASGGSGNYIIDGDVNGDKVADFSVAIHSDHVLTAHDFDL